MNFSFACIEKKTFILNCTAWWSIFQLACIFEVPLYTWSKMLVGWKPCRLVYRTILNLLTHWTTFNRLHNCSYRPSCDHGDAHLSDLHIKAGPRYIHFIYSVVFYSSIKFSLEIIYSFSQNHICSYSVVITSAVQKITYPADSHDSLKAFPNQLTTSF